MDTAILNQKIHLADNLSTDYLNYIREMYKTQENKKEYIQLLSSTELNVDELILTDIAYSELVSTGMLKLISNPNLMEKITKYYRNYQFVATRVKELNTSNIQSINAAGEAAPNLKYHLQDLDRC